MHQSVVELGTDICRDVHDAREQVIRLRSELATMAGRGGLKIASAGTHPFSHWFDQHITEGERYAEIVKECSRLPAPISSSVCTCMLAFRIATWPSTS